MEETTGQVAGTDGSEGSEGPEVAAATAVPPPEPTFGQRWGNLLITGAILVLVAGAVIWVVRRGNPVALEIDGKPITNATDVLADATAAFERVVETDGAHPPEGAGCWFAPPPASSSPVRVPGRPRLACGPVRLGMSTGDAVWVIGTVRYTPDRGGDGWTAELGELRAPEALDARALARPDGADPPSTTGLADPDPALRDRDGRRVLDEAKIFDTVEPSLRPAAEQEGAAIADDAACWFGLDADDDHPYRSDGALWCGPVLLASSEPEELFVRVSLSLQRGDTAFTAKGRANELTAITGTRSFPDGTRLYRPDGRPPPTPGQLTPPDPDAERPGHVEVVAEVPAGLGLTPLPGDPRLIIPTRTLQLDGFARVPRLGEGRRAIVAAANEELVVARFRRTDPARSTGNKGTARIVTGDRRRPLAAWPNLRESGLLVVSAPRGSDPRIEVTYDGVAQSLSLTTGQRGGEARPALYRTTADVALNAPLDVSVPLPDGSPPARVAGTAVSARLDAWRDRLGWAPAGKAFLAVTVHDLVVTTPCCAVRAVQATPRWTLALPDGAVIEARTAPAPAPGAPTAVVFDVPDTVTATELRLALDVTWAGGRGSGGPVAIPLEVPR